ncbi:hypothetical protein ACWEVM_00780 [Streptomyces bauhiniae]|uniref:hypothetical protein n=1 Tax=Streptomyces bauhiniae TaxID=2340725 RepID=UPI00369D4B5B
MDAHARHDEEVFLLHAGVSIERLAKATLSKISPFLLMELKGNDDTLLHLAGVKEASKIRTAGANQVIGRLRTIGVLPAKDSELDELIELRNGVAHLEAASIDSFDGLATFARVSNTLLVHLDAEPVEFWGDWNGAITIALDDALMAVAREIGGRIEQAKYRLSRRLNDVPADAVEIIYANANDGADAGGFGVRVACGDFTHHSPFACPACKCTGHLVTSIPGLGATPEGEPRRYFMCPLCSFSASGTDELAAAGLPANGQTFNEDGEVLISFDPSNLDDYIRYAVLDEDSVAKLVRFLSNNVSTPSGE